MADWLTNLTQPQATLGSAAITVFGAIIAVLIGWKLFSAKVRDMRSALTATEELLTEHQTRVQNTLADIEVKIGGLAASTGQLRADVSDNQALVEKVQPAELLEEREQIRTEGANFEAFAASWTSVRDHLEDIAADIKDGRTAAKYARIDRRSYVDLVVALNRDSRLGENGQMYLEAAQIWASHRTRKRPLTIEVAQRMESFAQLVGLAPEQEASSP